MAKRTSNSSKTASAISADCQILALHGKELMLQKLHLDKFKDALAKKHGEIDTINFDGQTAQLSQVLDEVRGYSLMGGFKVIVVDDAQDFIKAYRPALERYAQKPVDHATLVFRSATWNSGNLDKKIAKVGAVIKCDLLKPAEAAKWLVNRAKKVHDSNLDSACAKLLVETVGCDMANLDSELSKLILMAGEKGVDKHLIEQSVGKTNEQKAWVVQEAVIKSMLEKNPTIAIKKVHELVDLGGQPEILIMYSVCDLLRKLSIGTMMMRGKASDSQITSELRLWGAQKQMYMKVMRNLSAKQVGKLFSRCVEMDAKAKIGFGEPMRNLEKICVIVSAPANK